MNNDLFSTGTPGAIVPPTDTTNLAGGVAYSRPAEEALAQVAVTGCFGDTYYAKAEAQLADVLRLAAQCAPEWLAKCALYSRRSGQMKDMPAVLCAMLAKRDVATLKKIFPRVIDNGKLLRNFVQAVRSGVVGRKSFGTAVRRLIREWLETRTDEQLFHASIGEKPSLGDIVKMVHPKPKDEARRTMLAYLIGRPVASVGLLPEAVQQLEALKRGEVVALPDINFQFLSSLTLTDEQWATICDRASWQTLRMNLNTFERHGAFKDAARLARAIERLRDPEEIRKVRPMPYQLMAAYTNVSAELPGLKMALAQASDLALANVPKFPPNTVIGVDVSRSMSSALTGARGSATSAMRCVDVAALFACAVLKTTPTARICAFDVVPHQGELAGSVVESAAKLAAFGGGGTDCSIPLQAALSMDNVDAVVIVSDNESWFDNDDTSKTKVMQYWRLLQSKNRYKVKLVCIDLTPSTTRQTVVEKNVLNVGGFSDAVFDVVASFLSEQRSWLQVIEEVAID